MAGNIKGITVEIGGDTSGLTRSLSDVNKSIRTVQSELRQVEKSLKLDPKNTDLLVQKQKLLGEQIKDTKSKLEGLKDAQQKADEAMARGEEVNEEGYRQLQREIVNTENQLRNLEEQERRLSDPLTGVAEKLEKVGKKSEELGKKFAPVSAAAGAMLAGMVASFNEVDKGYDTIVEKTGATGEALKGLKDDMDAVYGSVPTTAEDAGIAVGELNTRFHVTGEELRNLSTEFIEFAKINNVDLNGSIANTQKIMSAWNIETEKTGEVLGLITKKAQDTGISVDSLFTAVLSNQGTFKELDLTLEESVGLMADFEKNGVNASTALMGMKKAAANYAKDGKSVKEGLEETISSIKNAADETEALAIAQEVFGTRGALEMATAIREGRFSLEDLTDSTTEYGKVVKDTFEGTLDAPDHLKVLLNNLKIAGAELGDTLLTSLMPTIEKLIATAKRWAQGFANMSDGSKKLIVAIVAITAAISPALIIFGKLATGISAVIKVVQTLIPLIGAALANPVGLAVMAFGALVAAIGAVAIASHNYSDETDALLSDVEALKTKTDELTASIENNKKAYEDSVIGAEAEAAKTRALADELYNLSDKTEKTAEDKAKMKSIVDELNRVLPDLKIKYNEETGTLETLREEIENTIAAKERMAKADAAYELMTNAYKSQLEAQQTMNELVEKRRGILEQLNNLQPVGKDIFGNDIYNFKPLVDALNDVDQKIEETKKAFSDSSITIDQAMDVIGQTATDNGEAVVLSASQIAEAVKQKFGEDFPNSTASAKQALTDFYTEMQSSGQYSADFMAAWKAAIDTGSDDVFSSYESFFSYVIGILGENGTSIEAAAMLLGIELPQGMKSGIESGEPEATGKAAELGQEATNALENNVDGEGAGAELSGGVKDGIEEGKTPAVNSASELGTGLTNALKKPFANIQSWATSVGSNLIAGLKNGISNFADKFLFPKVTSIVTRIKTAFAGIKGFNIGSPSRWAKEIGEYLMQGLVIGMKNEEGAVYETADDIVKTLKERFANISTGLGLSQTISENAFKIWKYENPYATEEEKLKKEGEALIEQHTEQGKAVELANVQYEKMVELYGESSNEAKEALAEVQKQTLAYYDLGDAIAKVREQLSGLNEQPKMKSEVSWISRFEEGVKNALSLAQFGYSADEQRAYAYQYANANGGAFTFDRNVGTSVVINQTISTSSATPSEISKATQNGIKAAALQGVL